MINFFDYNHLYYKQLKNKIKLATVVEGDKKTPFSIATTPRGVGKGATPFPGLLLFTIDT